MSIKDFKNVRGVNAEDPIYDKDVVNLRTLRRAIENSTSGTGGIAGTSGTSGFDGTSGIDGSSGSSGQMGTSGTSGTSGTGGSVIYSEINDFLQNVPLTINHNLNTTNVLTQIVDNNTNELIYGFIDNYQPNSIDVTLSENLNNIKTIIAGGTFVEISGATANTFTTGATLNGTTIEFNRTDQTNAYNVDLSPLISISGTSKTSLIITADVNQNVDCSLYNVIIWQAEFSDNRTITFDNWTEGCEMSLYVNNTSFFERNIEVNSRVDTTGATNNSTIIRSDGELIGNTFTAFPTSNRANGVKFNSYTVPSLVVAIGTLLQSGTKKSTTLNFGRTTVNTNLLNTTTYYFGSTGISDNVNPTITSPAHEIRASHSGIITDISVLVYVGSTYASDDGGVVVSLHNLTKSTNQQIGTASDFFLSFNSLGTGRTIRSRFTIPGLLVDLGDIIQVRWVTPNWTTPPTDVKMEHIITINEI